MGMGVRKSETERGSLGNHCLGVIFPFSTRETFIDEPHARLDVRKVSVRHARSMHIL